MGRRSTDQPLHLTRVRVVPCEDVGEVFNTVLKRVLNARAAIPVRTDAQADERDEVGETDG